MTTRAHILNRFGPQAEAGPTSLLLDLTLWCKWRCDRQPMPAPWNSVIDAARALGTPVWAPFKPWRVEYDGVEVTTEETGGKRDIIYRTGGRTLLAQWTVGPDGDWWQTEYPVKTLDDLTAAVEIAAARRYVVEEAGLAEWRAAVGEDGVVPLELPMRPYSDVLHTLVGWSEGVALMVGRGKPLVAEIIAILERGLNQLTASLAGLDGDLWLAADNLDGQYISPRAFAEYLTPSYAVTVETARRCGKPMVVHIGGPSRKLVPLLAQVGADGIEGIAGPPQGDAILTEARAAAGPDITLWGGIPQDLLIAEHDESVFEAAVRAAIEQARADASGRMIVGVADRVPVDAELDRLKRLVEMMSEAQSR